MLNTIHNLSGPHFFRVIVLFSITILSSCTTINYYSQSALGQVKILLNREPIDDVINRPETPLLTRQKLNTIRDIVYFAESSLALPAGGSYQEYVDTGRKFVVWNVFAAPELSLKSKRWCFLIVGCLSYRGYFSWRDANNYAEKLEQQGLDTYIGGVAAYSTLGWFRDPVLNTMLNRDDPYLAKLIFHELAHQKLYIEDDTEFNEAFAEAVGFIGTKMWLQDQGHEIKTIFTNKNRREKQFYDLVLGVRNSLNKIYDSSIPDQEKRNLKQETIAKLRDEYSELRNQWNNNTDYDSWFNNDINNAKLAAVSTYRLLVPEFISLYEKTGNDLDLFYSLIDQLKTCDKKTRYTMLRQKSLKVIC